jgi:antirestriction protein ArdC
MSNTEQASNAPTSIRRDIHQQVTDIIIKQLEKGTVPWHKPWKGEDTKAFDLPYNGITKNHYRGINIVLLWSSAIEKQYASAEWGTFKQWADKKEMIRKGEKGSMIVYYDTIEKEEDDEIRKIPFLKTSYVFNRCQLNSYQPSEKEGTNEPRPSLVERIQTVDDFIGNTKAIIEHGQRGACFSPNEDKIYMPVTEAFVDTESCTATEGYYSTLLHELVHWSGTPNRLDRTKGKKFGDQNYATEELVAELGAAFLCTEYNIATAEKGDHASYIAGWLKVLKDNKHCIITAASEASKAVHYLKGLQPQ